MYVTDIKSVRGRTVMTGLNVLHWQLKHAIIIRLRLYNVIPSEGVPAVRL